jgi:hypothetical protein
MNHPRRSPLIVLLLCALLLPGCLVHDTTLLLRYDPASDTFRLFTLFEHYRSTTDGLPVLVPAGSRTDTDADHRRRIADRDAGTLRELWSVRDRAIFLPLPLSLDGPLRLELAEDHSHLTAGQDLLPPNADIPWRDVQIRPGHLFRDRNGFLGYSHEVTFPGRALDQLLAAARAQWADSPNLRAQIDEVINLRRRTPTRPDDWSAYTQATARAIAATTHPAATDNAAPADATPLPSADMRTCKPLLACMDDASLDALRTLFAPGSPGPDLTRAGTTLRLRLPLTRRDAAGLKTLARTWADALRATTANPSTPEDKRSALLLNQTLRSLANASTTDTPSDGDFLVTLDLLPALNQTSQAVRQYTSATFANDDTAKSGARALANAVRRWHTPAPNIETIPDPEALLKAFQDTPAPR